jgi:uncharacterized DUF497 family protein
MIKFEWNQAKSRSNQKKHGVSFEEAQTVFYDDFAIQFFDETNSSLEDRFLEALSLDYCLCATAREKRGIASELSQPEKRLRASANIIVVRCYESRI